MGVIYIERMFATKQENRRRKEKDLNTAAKQRLKARKGKCKVIEELKEAVITPDKKIQCPICGKTNGMITGKETIRNYKVRCRGSRRGWEHFFMLNTEMEEKENE